MSRPSRLRSSVAFCAVLADVDAETVVVMVMMVVVVMVVMMMMPIRSRHDAEIPVVVVMMVVMIEILRQLHRFLLRRITGDAGIIRFQHG